MLKYSWKELGRLESIFLEILDDPTKKEVLLYPICYCQLVRKLGTFEVPLEKLISCASKTFKTSRGRWQDVLLELDLFQIILPTGEVVLGKDLLRLKGSEDLRVSFLPEYREVFYEIYSRFLKYWTVLSKVSSYSKRNTPAEAVYLTALIFNEELFSETRHYSDLQKLRFPKDENIFNVLEKLGEFYSKIREKKFIDAGILEEVSQTLEGIGDTYYGLNTGKLKKDVSSLIKDVTKGRGYSIIKVSFTMGANHGRGWVRRLISGLVSKVRRIGGKRWTLMNSETVCYSSIEACLIRQRSQLTPN